MRTWKNRHRQPKKSNRKTRSRKQRGGRLISAQRVIDYLEKSGQTSIYKSEYGQAQKAISQGDENIIIDDDIIRKMEKFETAQRQRVSPLSSKPPGLPAPFNVPSSKPGRTVPSYLDGLRSLSGAPQNPLAAAAAAAREAGKAQFPQDMGEAAAARLAGAPPPPNPLFDPRAAAPEEPLPAFEPSSTFDQTSAASAAKLGQIPGAGIENPLAGRAAAPPPPQARLASSAASPPQAPAEALQAFSAPPPPPAEALQAFSAPPPPPAAAPGFRDRFARVDGARNGPQRTLADCDTDLAAARERIAALSAESAREKAELGALRQQEEQARGDLERFRAAAEPQIQELSQQLAALRAESAADKPNLERLRAILDVLKQQLANAATDEELSREVEGLAARLAAGQVTQAALTADVNRLDAGLVAKQGELERNIAEHADNLREIEARHTAALAELRATHADEVQNIQGRLDRAEARIAELGAENKADSDRLRRETRELREALEQEQARLREVVLASEREKGALQAEAAQAVARAEAAAREAAAARDRLGPAEEELTRLRASGAEVAAERAALNATLQALQPALAESRASDAAAKEALEAARQAEAALRAESRQLEQELRLANAETRKALEVQGAELGGDLAEQAREIDNLRRAAEEAERARDELVEREAAHRAELLRIANNPPVITTIVNRSNRNALVYQRDGAADLGAAPNMNDQLQITWDRGGNIDVRTWVLVVYQTTPAGARGDAIYSQLISNLEPFEYTKIHDGPLMFGIFGVVGE